jgi:hypothetical protein
LVSTSPLGYVTIFGETRVPTPDDDELEGEVGCNPRVTFDERCAIRDHHGISDPESVLVKEGPGAIPE